MTTRFPEPSEPAENGRDVDGRFQPGCKPGPGRPRGGWRAPSAWKIAIERAEKEGFDLEEAIWRVVRKLLTAAQNGDVAAAKLVFDKLCPEPPASVQARVYDNRGQTLAELIAGSMQLEREEEAAASAELARHTIPTRRQEGDH